MAGVVSLVPPCVTFKMPLVGKATGSHLMNSTSLEEIQSTVSGFYYAEIEYAMQYTYSYTLLMHIPILKPIGD